MFSKSMLPLALLVCACGSEGETPAGSSGSEHGAAAERAETEPSREASAATRDSSESDPQLASASIDLQLHTRREQEFLGSPEWLAHVDVDGDGVLEVIAATNSPGGLILWRDPQEAPERIAFGDFPLRPVSFAGAVVVASRSDKTISFVDLSKPGAPRLIAKHELEDVPMVMVAGVLDPKRGEELIVACREGLIARGSQTNTWTSQRFNGSLPRCATILSPELDLVIGYQGSNALEVFRAGAADELELRTRTVLPGTARDLLAMDVDGDGNKELLVVGGDHGGWILGPGTEDPFDKRAKGVEFETTAIPMRMMPLPEQRVGDETRSRWAVLAGKSVGLEIWNWTEDGPVRTSFSYAGQTPGDFLLQDGDGDGREDFWVANRDAHRVSLMRMGELGTIDPYLVRVGAFPNDLATGDLDGDGRPEVFVINAKDNDISVLVRGKDRPLFAKYRVPTGRSPRGVRSADINSDGHHDLLWLERRFDGTRLNLSLGDGKLDLKTPAEYKPFPMGIGCREFVVARFPVDKRPVLVAADQEGRKLIWTRVGSGEQGELTFEPLGELALPDPPRTIATLHAGGQARGVVVAMQKTRELSVVQLYTPNVSPEGLMAWELQAQIELPGAVLDIDTGDLDGNGIEDVLYLASDREGSVQGHVRPLMVQGAVLQPVGRFHTDLLPQRVLAKDFNGDGLAEIFVANLDSHNVNAWRTIQGPDGLSFVRLRDVGAGAGCIALGSMDYEGDGDEDLLVVDSANDGISLILNEMDASGN